MPSKQWAEPAARLTKGVRLAMVGGALAMATSCSSPVTSEFTQQHAAALRDSVTRFAGIISSDIADRGPIAFADHFSDTPSFFMASDGRLRFPSHDSAVAFLAGFARGISRMEFEWLDLQIDPLAPGLAMIASPFYELLADTAGGVIEMEGFYSAVAEHTAEGWRLRNAHWSIVRPD